MVKKTIIILIFAPLLICCEARESTDDNPANAADSYGYAVPPGISHRPLALVNKNHAFDPGINENSLIPLTSSANYQRRDNLQKLMPEAKIALDTMMEEFVHVMGRKAAEAIVSATHRTAAYQQGLVDAKPGLLGSYLAQPGHSEHHTGYAVDMHVYRNGLTYEMIDFPATFDWLYENMHKYGYIVRYTEEKKHITGLSAEPWHFRYVGIPHAAYIKENNLALEEYIDLIRARTPSNPLVIIGAPPFYIYFVPADSPQIPYYSGHDYEISGNNVDGYIVTNFKSDYTQ